MNDKTNGQEAETGPQTAQPEPKMPVVDTTVAVIEEPASGPSLQLHVDDGELANLRVQTVHCKGEACALDKISSKELKDEQGNVCIVAVAAPLYGGGEMLASAVGSRGRVKMKLTHNDGKGSDINGDFVVSRFSPQGVVNGEQLYTIVLENAGPEEKADEDK